VTEQDQQGPLLWKKSTASGSSGCLEVARVRGMTLVRDSKAPEGTFLTLSGAAWEKFLKSARLDQFEI
jgi:Domain of unknown function (DUF397)